MPAVLALPAFWGAVGATAAGATSMIGAGEAAAATEDAAHIQADTAAKALDFQKQKAAQDLAQQNAIQKANYDQWAASQRRASNFAQMLGLPAFDIPSYQPIPNALSATTTAPTASTGLPAGAATSGSFPTAPSGGSPTDTAAIQSALEQNYKALGVTPTGRGTGPTDIAYYADQIANTGGLTPQNFSYWFGPQGRIATDIGGHGAAGATATTASAATPLTYAPLNPLTAMTAPMPVAAAYTPTPNNFAYLLNG